MGNGKRISIKDARILEQEYVKTRANSLNTILKKKGLIESEDVRDVWFDLEALKDYIAYVEQTAAKKGITKNLGLRVYFGAYPDKQEYEDKRGKATVVFLPTHSSYGSENENFSDLDGFNWGGGGWPPNGF